MQRAWQIFQHVIVLCFGLFSAYLGSAFLIDQLSAIPAPADKLVWGTVIERRFAPQRFRLRGPRLAIRIDGTGEVVHADLANEPIDRLPDRVSFYYGADPRKEVRLIQERGLVLEIITIYGGSALMLVLPILSWRTALKAGAKKPAVEEACPLRGLRC